MNEENERIKGDQGQGLEGDEEIMAEDEEDEDDQDQNEGKIGKDIDIGQESE